MLQKLGWTVEGLAPTPLPSLVLARYPWIPSDVRSLLETYRTIANQDNTAWFLTGREFAGEAGSAYAWNEWERQSLEAAGGDAKWQQSIRAFWDAHIPIVLTVKSGYGYFAVERSGTIVRGEEPEYEDVRVVAPTLEEFLRLLAEDGARFEAWM